jgi:hypothetical protein
MNAGKRQLQKSIKYVRNVRKRQKEWKLYLFRIGLQGCFTNSYCKPVYKSLFSKEMCNYVRLEDFMAVWLRTLFFQDITRVAQKVMPHFFFLRNYLFRMCEIHAQYNWMFPLHMLFFHIISIYVYGLTPARNKGLHAFPVPARFLFM